MCKLQESPLEILRNKKHIFESYLQNLYESQFGDKELPLSLKSALEYSLLGGGKRFRPLLIFSVGELFKIPDNRLLPFSAAVEMMHTYSLVHDDLPCMDNDDFRRGEPTNHKKYGEALALLAGDALLTDSFLFLARSYGVENAALAIKLVEILSLAAGSSGMIAGQVLDMKALDQAPLFSELEFIHSKKTGALIQLSIEGSARIGGANEEELLRLKQMGFSLGMAFQIADDLLDFQDSNQDGRSYVFQLGLQGAHEHLRAHTQKALEILEEFEGHKLLKFLVEGNSQRVALK